MTVPFHTSHAVPVDGGTLHVARGGPAPADSAAVVLAAHGITASHQAWRAPARNLLAGAGVCVLAPDLRGRGQSAQLQPPANLGQHVTDLVAILDHLGVERAVLAGHSMGAYVVARTAAEHPERATGVVLVDGGTPTHPRPDIASEETLAKLLGPALQRLSMTFDSPEHYVEFWRQHPAYGASWSEDIEAYVRADLTGADGAWRSVTSERAVRADGVALLTDETTLTAAERIRGPLRLLRAPRGLLDDEHVVISDTALDDFRAAQPDAAVELVEDVNHYTILMGAGAPRVAEAIRRVLGAPAAAVPG
jgi:pimeloyl-ACP methyl ester carboxylesterase